MKGRKSYLTNFPTNSLFAVLEQTQKELMDLELGNQSQDNILRQERIRQLKLTISIIKNIIIDRYLSSNTSLREYAKLLITSSGIKKIIYQEVFTLKLSGTDEIISLDMLKKAIDKLEIEQLMRIMHAKENSIYGDIVNQSYMEMLFNVEEEILGELKQKIKLDN